MTYRALSAVTKRLLEIQEQVLEACEDDPPWEAIEEALGLGLALAGEVKRLKGATRKVRG